MDDEQLRDDEQQPQVKINDRRAFAADGSLRDAADGAPEAPDAGAAGASDSAATTDATDANAEPATTAGAEPAAPTDGADPLAAPGEPSIADLPRDFSAFIETLYMEAMLYMGAVPHPTTGEALEDLEAARYKIDILALLAEKTKGNLTPVEHQQLDGILYQLRMMFVQKNN